MRAMINAYDKFQAGLACLKGKSTLNVEIDDDPVKSLHRDFLSPLTALFELLKNVSNDFLGVKWKTSIEQRANL
jgi:hypothetical protein